MGEPRQLPLATGKILVRDAILDKEICVQALLQTVLEYFDPVRVTGG
jgi:hypothetical protein